MVRLKVIIVNWQRPADTLECIQSLLDAGVLIDDILLVDNGSGDDSVEVIQSTQPKLNIKCLPENIGYAGGYNIGINLALAAEASHIFLLNNDTKVHPRAVSELMNSGWDVAIPKILFYDQPDKIWSAGARWRFFPPAVVMNGYGKLDTHRYDLPHSLSYATGCAILAKRQVLLRVNGFDQDFENYMEDYDFFFRIRRAGFAIGYVPQARIFHKVSATLGHTSPQRWHYLGRNTVLFYRKDHRFPGWMLWSYLGWFLIRELVKGNAGVLSPFIAGVKEGLAYVNRNREK